MSKPERVVKVESRRLEEYAKRARENPQIVLAIKESDADVTSLGLTAEEFRREFLGK